MNTTYELRTTLSDWQTLFNHVLRPDGLEHAGFLLVSIRDTSRTKELIVREVILIRDCDLVGGPQSHFLEIKPERLLEVINHAIREGLALVEVHSHPDEFSTSDFSISDEHGFREIVPYMLRSLPVPLYSAMIIAGETDVQAVVWDRSLKDRFLISKISIVDPTVIRRLFLTESVENSALVALTRDELEKFDRQVRAFGAEGQATIRGIKVALIGLGGLGSLMASQLARMGVGNFVLVDHDFFEKSNLNRVDGSLTSDATLGRSKVEIALRHIREINPNAQIATHQKKMFHPDAIRDIASSDLIIGGVDNDACRFALNNISLAYLRPYIDLATEIHTESRELLHAGGRYTFVFPGEGCLLCAQALDLKEIGEFFTPYEVRQHNQRTGYISGSEEKAPSVMPLNSVIVSHAVCQILKWICGVGSPNIQMHFNFLEEQTTKITFERSESCIRCNEFYGMGDLTDLSKQYETWAA